MISIYLGLDRADWFLLEEATRPLFRENGAAVREVADELRKRGALAGDEVARIVKATGAVQGNG